MTHKIYEAAVDETGRIRLIDTVTCSGLTRALVIVLESIPRPILLSTGLSQTTPQGGPNSRILLQAFRQLGRADIVLCEP